MVKLEVNLKTTNPFYICCKTGNSSKLILPMVLSFDWGWRKLNRKSNVIVIPYIKPSPNHIQIHQSVERSRTQQRRAVMVMHRIELCITMVRTAIEFVIAVAETVATVQGRTLQPLRGSLNRTSTLLPFSGFMP